MQVAIELILPLPSEQRSELLHRSSPVESIDWKGSGNEYGRIGRLLTVLNISSNSFSSHTSHFLNGICLPVNWETRVRETACKNPRGIHNHNLLTTPSSVSLNLISPLTSPFSSAIELEKLSMQMTSYPAEILYPSIYRNPFPILQYPSTLTCIEQFEHCVRSDETSCACDENSHLIEERDSLRWERRFIEKGKKKIIEMGKEIHWGGKEILMVEGGYCRLDPSVYSDGITTDCDCSGTLLFCSEWMKLRPYEQMKAHWSLSYQAKKNR